MKTITRKELVDLGGAPDARFAIFYASGELYVCTTAATALLDEAYWAERGYTCKQVVE